MLCARFWYSDCHRWSFWNSKIGILNFSHLKTAIFSVFFMNIRQNLKKYGHNYGKTYIILVEKHLRHISISSLSFYLHRFSCLLLQLQVGKLRTWRLEYISNFRTDKMLGHEYKYNKSKCK